MRKIQFVGLILLALVVLALPSGASGQVAVGISVHIGPPALPVYAQPICPGPGYIWTPGYWAYGEDGYYWVPGTWVVAPEPGLLWTPGYWGFAGGVYGWHTGYWGPHVGFYGGINYGFGYGGVGFVGGRWNRGVFEYNTAITNVNTTVIHNTYVNKTVINNTTVNRVSFNGGEGGTNARPNREEMAAEHEHHVAPTSMQTQHEHAASTNRALRASENHGRPAVAATSKPGEFSGHGVEAARAERNAGSNGNRPPNANRPANNAAATHNADRPPSHGNNGNSSSSHPNNSQANNGHVNNAHMNSAVNSPKNQPHGENKPHAESKPGNKPENKPGEKPHLR